MNMVLILDSLSFLVVPLISQVPTTYGPGKLCSLSMLDQQTPIESTTKYYSFYLSFLSDCDPLTEAEPAESRAQIERGSMMKSPARGSGSAPYRTKRAGIRNLMRYSDVTTAASNATCLHRHSVLLYSPYYTTV